MDPAMPLGLWLLPLLLVISARGLASASTQGNNLEICLLPLERGPCRALISRFYYNRNQQRCRKFKYGGCLGNANNFHSRDSCEHTCGNIEKVPPICRLKLKTYPCDKPYVEYFFNLNTMTCEPLSLDLCSKSMNIFPDENACKKFCEPSKIPSFCSSPKDEGLCSANLTRYYFNSRNKACETFTYTGCGGNENNFYYLDDCDRACVKAPKKSKKRKTESGFRIRTKPRRWNPRLKHSLILEETNRRQSSQFIITQQQQLIHSTGNHYHQLPFKVKPGANGYS